jgi:hypothetical protein
MLVAIILSIEERVAAFNFWMRSNFKGFNDAVPNDFTAKRLYHRR